VTVNTEKTFTCVATGLPKPIRLEWSLDDSSLDIVDSQMDSNSGEMVRQVRGRFQNTYFFS
jgi:hypothetical protein